MDGVGPVAADWAERFARVRVLIVGDAMLDRYVRGSVDRISPEAPVPIFLAREEFDRLGGAANVAANIAALGGAGDLLALVGRAPPGEGGGAAEKNATGAFDAVGGPRGSVAAAMPPRLAAPGKAAATVKELMRRADWAAVRLALRCAGFGFTAHLLPLLDGTIVKTRLLAGQQQILRIDHEASPAPYAATVGAGIADRPALGTVLMFHGNASRVRKDGARNSIEQG